MVILSEIVNELLLEQDSKIDIIRQSILERIPMSIYYRGPANEVREGQRIDIEPVVLGKHIRTGNLVIWAFVFKGISKKGLPGWKMFRVDRIVSAKLNFNVKNFDLDILPGYQKGKAPNAMKSLSSVDIYSPYWYKEGEKIEIPPTPEQPERTEPEPPTTEIPPIEQRPIEKPSNVSNKEVLNRINNDLKSKIKNINGQNLISQIDYDNALKDLYNSKEKEFKIYQRAISGNLRPGEGTRKRFTDTSKAELDKLLATNNIKLEQPPSQLSEINQIQKRFKRLTI